MTEVTEVEPRVIFGITCLAVYLVVAVGMLWSWGISMINDRPETYIYGTCLHSETNSRFRARKTKSGDIEFVMWKAGEQGHTEDYWLKIDDRFKKTFIRNDKYEFIKIVDEDT